MSEAAVERFRELQRIPTVSRLDESTVDWPRFDEFVTALERLYPRVHAVLERETVAGHSLLYRWPGRSAEAPTVLMAHYDVVAATAEGWEHPPFGAELTGSGDGRMLWGRGTIDDKGALVGILEAVEARLAAGFIPARDIYLSFGHDEETNGSGALAIADLLEERGIRPDLVLDEGGAIADDAFPGLAGPIAVVGVAEKGTTIVRLVVEEAGGHASTPPTLGATDRLARAIVRVGRRPFPSAFTPTALEMFRTVGTRTRGALGFAFRHVGLTRGLLLPAFARISDETRAMTRTTVAVTMLEAGLAANALAETATATLNLRIAIGSSVADAVAHLRRAIADDRVRIEVAAAGEPSSVSPTTGRAWDLLAVTLAETHPGTVMTPYVQNGATDSRHFTRICANVYRFTPFELPKRYRDALHAVNERMPLHTWVRGIEFYTTLLGRL